MHKKKIFVVYMASLIGGAIWIGLVFLAPYLKGCSMILGDIIYAAFSPICHQAPSRCFFFHGYPLAVCTRCLGIYTGFMLGLILYPAVRGFGSISLPQTKLFIALLIPVFTDTLGNFFQIWATPGWMRFILGLAWGLILPFYFIAGMADYLASPKKRFTGESAADKS